MVVGRLGGRLSPRAPLRDASKMPSAILTLPVSAGSWATSTTPRETPLRGTGIRE
jgi:hypothetical protein